MGLISAWADLFEKPRWFTRIDLAVAQMVRGTCCGGAGAERLQVEPHT
jgi:hypothetical protein